MKLLPPELHASYKRHYGNHSQPRLGELQSIFFAVLQQLESIYFVLDALDECTQDQRVGLCGFFAGIMELSVTASKNIKLFVTSRKEPDIERAFSRFSMIEVEATKVNNDIEIYVQGQIEQQLNNGSLPLNNPMLKDKIITTLTTKAGGMYVFSFHYLYFFVLSLINYVQVSLGPVAIGSSMYTDFRLWNRRDSGKHTGGSRCNIREDFRYDQ